MGTGIVSRGMKQPERDVDQSHPSRAEIKNEWSYTSTPPIYPLKESTMTTVPVTAFDVSQKYQI